MAADAPAAPDAAWPWWATAAWAAALAAGLAVAAWGALAPPPAALPVHGALAWLGFAGGGLVLYLVGFSVVTPQGERTRVTFFQAWAVVAPLAGAAPAIAVTCAIILADMGHRAFLVRADQGPAQPHVRAWIAALGYQNPAARIRTWATQPPSQRLSRTFSPLAYVLVAIGAWRAAQGAGPAALIPVGAALDWWSLAYIATFYPPAKRPNVLSWTVFEVARQLTPVGLAAVAATVAGVLAWGWIGLALPAALAFVLNMAGQRTVLLAERTAALRLAELAAHTDALTGLPNRRTLEEYVARLTAEAMPCVVAICDIDHFKRVNDTWGHDAGDAVLQAVARRLQAACRTQRDAWPDLVARFGGEEFVLVLPRLPWDAAPGRAEAIRQAVGATPVLFGQTRIPVTASLGATWCPDGVADFAAVLKRADTALYRAKESGRNRSCWQPDLLVPPPADRQAAPG